jgi:carotenoid cleavage dioxygenase-like enzyme
VSYELSQTLISSFQSNIKIMEFYFARFYRNSFVDTKKILEDTKAKCSYRTYMKLQNQLGEEPELHFCGII